MHSTHGRGLRWVRHLAAAALLLSGLGCASGLDPSELQLVDAERKWIAAGIEDYSMVVTRGALPDTPVAVLVTVRGGLVTDRRYAGTDDPVPAADAAKFPSINGLFDLVRDAFDHAASVTVNFDPTYGFPTSFVVDYDRSILDDDLTVAVTQFAPAP